MNCLEFRRLKLADPRQPGLAAAEHAAHCETCRAFARRTDEIEARLAGEIVGPVPEGLADRVLLRVGAEHRLPLRLAALAAAVLLSLAAGRLERPGAAGGEAARSAIAHVRHEPEALKARQAVAEGELVRVAAAGGARLAGSLGRLRYLRNCPVPGGTGWHVVMDTGHGPATLILVPGVRLAAGGSARDERWLARTQPAGSGYYALVAESPAALAEAGRRVRQALRWPA